MTKEITKAYLLQELQDKFALRELEPEVFRFSETVIPVYDITPHLTELRISMETISITSSDGFLFFHVPETEKWFLHRYVCAFMGAGAIKIAGVAITRAINAHTHYMYLDLTKNQTISYAINMPHPVELSPGDKIWIIVDDYTSTQDFRLYIDYTKETIR